MSAAAARSEPAVRTATAADAAAIHTLLDGAALPTADLADGAPRRFWVAELDGRVVGAVALEGRGPDALLRSLVVAAEHRGHGLGGALVRALERDARAEGVQALWLLTQTAEPLFRALGYAVVDRRSAPPSLQASAEFRSLCPASATTMRRALS